MRRVVKVGGSLLTRTDLQSKLTEWLDRQGKAQHLLVIGGGELIDAIRRLDRIRPADSSDVHWQCIDLLDVTVGMMTGISSNSNSSPP